jgi:hypothetical protein
MLSRIARWIQNGQVQRYIVGLVLGGAVIFLVASRSHRPTFVYREVAGGVELRADPGEGIAGSNAHFRWDLDGDGEPDRRPGATGDDGFVDDAVMVVRPGDLGSEVTLWIDSPLAGKVAITRDIRLGHGSATGQPGAATSENR